MPPRTRWSTPALGALLLCACGAESAVEPPLEPPALVRPTGVETLTLELTEAALPAALAGAPLCVAVDAAVGTLVGGEGGLYLLSTEGLTPLDAAPVRGIVAWPGLGVIVGGESGVSVWTGSLQPSPLTESLQSADVLALAKRDGELWIGTTGELHRFEDDALTSFPSIVGASRIATFDGAEHVVVHTADAVLALSGSGDDFQSQQLSDELALDAVVPSQGGRILGVRSGALLERIRVDASLVAWRPVALAPQAEVGELSAQALAVDPSTGYAWVVTNSALALVAGDTVGEVARPASVSSVRSVSVTAEGALWVASDTSVVRLGRQGEPITYSANIAPFSAANCERCHVALGTARPLTSLGAWQLEVDRIIHQLAEGLMPQDGRPLEGGSVDLVRRWKLDGLRP